MTRLIAVLALALTFTAPAYALNSKLSATARDLISITVSADFTKAGRVKFVGLIAVYCREMLTTIPTNTPNENAWVETEGRTTDQSKINRLMSSPEWSRSELQDTFTRCVERTDKLTHAYLRPDELSNVVRYEAAHLISLALNFHYDGDIKLYARRAGLQPEELGLDFIGSVRKALLIASLRTLEDK